MSLVITPSPDRLFAPRMPMNSGPTCSRSHRHSPDDGRFGAGGPVLTNKPKRRLSVRSGDLRCGDPQRQDAPVPAVRATMTELLESTRSRPSAFALGMSLYCL